MVVNNLTGGVSHMTFCFQYPSQTCRLGLLYIWTRECEAVSVYVLLYVPILYKLHSFRI